MKNPLFNTMTNLLQGNNSSLQMAMKMLQAKNPQAYSKLNALISQGANPKDIALKQLQGASPQQIAQLETLGKQFGVSPDVLENIIKKG